jgi:hypothetical protein
MSKRDFKFDLSQSFKNLRQPLVEESNEDSKSSTLRETKSTVLISST